MGWSIGFDTNWNRDIGYGVPSICDHPNCDKEINRGLGYVCGSEPYGGDMGCGLFFCGKHQGDIYQNCERCCNGEDPFSPTPDTTEWNNWKKTDDSWGQWRLENPEKVKLL